MCCTKNSLFYNVTMISQSQTFYIHVPSLQKEKPLFKNHGKEILPNKGFAAHKKYSKNVSKISTLAFPSYFPNDSDLASSALLFELR